VAGKIVRLVDIGDVPGLRSQAVYHAVAEEVSVSRPDTLILGRSTDRYVSIGLYQEIARNIDAEYCASEGISVHRRQLGGCSILVDSGQQLFQAVFHKRNALRSVTRLYHNILRVAIDTYRTLGVDVHYMPVSEVFARDRSLGGSAVGRFADAAVLASGIVFDYDIEVAKNIFRQTEDRYTSVALERSIPVDRDAATKHFLSEYERSMEVTLEPGELSDAELEQVERYEQLLGSDEWVQQIDQRISEVKVDTGSDRLLGEGVNIVQGGLIRATIRVVDGVIDDLVLSGDFYFFEDHRHGLEEAFRGVGQEWDDLMTVAENYYLMHEVDSPGVEPTGWVTAISKAFLDANS
jgi:lipoate---protein ligase